MDLADLEFLSDRIGCLRVISGRHHNFNAHRMELLNGAGCRLLDGIGYPDKSDGNAIARDPDETSCGETNFSARFELHAAVPLL